MFLMNGIMDDLFVPYNQWNYAPQGKMTSLVPHLCEA